LVDKGGVIGAKNIAKDYDKLRLKYWPDKSKGINLTAPILLRLALHGWRLRFFDLIQCGETQSSSASRFTAGAFGFLTFTQCGERPDL
jgi:hypothetical protein